MLQVHITKWGNSLGFRIPRGIAASLGIQAGGTLELTPAEDGLLLKKARPTGKRYALPVGGCRYMERCCFRNCAPLTGGRVRFQ